MAFDWYKALASEKTGRLPYIYDPMTNTVVAGGSPIRDIASIWDMEILSDFLNRRDLEPVIERSIERYSRYLIKRDGCLILDPNLLGEPSNIAHSAFMILSLLHSRWADRSRPARLLADGILAQQRPHGSYKIYFGPEPDDGLDFYPGEAMLALLETYRMTGYEGYLRSVERGFVHYKKHYYERNRVRPDLLVFFANWQSQFCRLLYVHSRDKKIREEARDYVLELHDRIIERGFYENEERRPEQQAAVEAACALEGLNDAYAIAAKEKDPRVERYQKALCISLAYVLRVQCSRNCAEKETGGFGHSLSDRTQRTDVTGHFVNGMIKSLANRLAC